MRGSYFYDPTIQNKSGLNSTAEDILGSGAEVLDAYVRGTFRVANRNLNLRLGKQVVNWGESTFIQNGINVLNPINVSRLRAPGSELKEGLIPTMMAHATQELADNLSVEAVLPTEWKKTLIDPAGSFFSTNDFVAEGGDRAYTGYGRRRDRNQPDIAFNIDLTGQAQLWAPRGNDREASNSGQYGLAVRYLMPKFNNSEFGFYHANYHSRTPYVSGYRGGITSNYFSPAAGCAVFDAPTASMAGLAAGCAFAANRAGSYFVEYPEDIKLYGLSFNTALPNGMALQGEYSYRHNQPMQLPSAELLNAALGAASQLTTLNPVAARTFHAYGDEIIGYRRVKMHQIQFTGTKAFGPTFGAEQFALVGEVGYTRLELPSDLKFAAPGCHLPQPGSSATSAFNSTSSDCFATENSWGYRLVGRLDYPNAMGAATVSPRLAFSHDVEGRSPTFNEGAKALTLGVGLNYKQKWQADIAYTAFFGGKRLSGEDPVANTAGQLRTYASHTNPMADRDFLSVSVSYSF